MELYECQLQKQKKRRKLLIVFSFENKWKKLFKMKKSSKNQSSQINHQMQNQIIMCTHTGKNSSMQPHWRKMMLRLLAQQKINKNNKRKGKKNTPLCLLNAHNLGTEHWLQLNFLFSKNKHREMMIDETPVTGSWIYKTGVDISKIEKLTLPVTKNWNKSIN